MSGSFKIRSPEQLEAISLPIRTEIVECVACLGPCSVGDLSEIMGQKRPVLYFHVEKLVAAGLLLPDGERGEGRRREITYRTPGTPVYIIYDRDDPHNIELTTRYSKNLFTQIQRQLAKAFASRAAVTNGPSRDTYANQMTAWLSADELSEVNDLIKKLTVLMKPSQPAPGKSLHNLTLGLAPLKPKGSVRK